MDPTVVAVAVAGDGRGRLEVSWTLEGHGAVEVAVGPAPDAIDHEHPVAVVDGGDRVVLGDLGPGRHYVAVAPVGGGPGMVGAERLVTLEGAVNFRDLGGYPTAGGGRTRWGHVFRSDALHALTVEDAAFVGQLGLRVVYDLRSDVERDRWPSVLGESVRSVQLAIGGATSQTKEITERILDGEIEGIDDEYMAAAYHHMAANDAGTFAALLTGLTDPGGLPALFHCTAGKDRTGMTAAMLLSVLGVDEDAVLDDYELTSRYWTDHRVAGLQPKFAAAGIDIARFAALFSAPRGVLATWLATLRQQHGTIDRYLVEEGGMEPEAIDELRRLLVVQPA
ncbi:MAG: protein tyrosine/serine phosphatase [Actinomycetia bacterium]|nr:protein tyrosine/serine phosphatase [Actinomycetes bacterium]